MAPFHIRGVGIVPADRSVRRNGESIHLRPKIFDLLMYLVRNRDRMVPKQELLDRVWGNAAIGDNSLAQCVNELRRALGDPDLIRTYPKAGYRFMAGQPARNRFVPWAIATAVLFAAGIAYAAVRLHHRAPYLGEVAWWRLDESAGTVVADSVRPSGAGALVGVAVWTAGRLGNALRLEYPLSHVRGKALGLPAGDAPRTIALWVKALPNGDETGLFHYGETGAGPRSYSLWLTDTGLPATGNRFYGGQIVGTTLVADDRWHLLASSYDGPSNNLLRLYVDGRLEAAGVLPRRPETGRAFWSIGKHWDWGASVRGLIDDVRVYSRALRESEVAALYRCATGAVDALLDGNEPMYNLPIWPDRRADLSGAQFARAAAPCAESSLRGADLGQDLRIEADVLVPVDPHGYVTSGGPYFRSRRAAAGDGIVGPVSAGYWVAFDSKGGVKVRALNPQVVVAFAKAPAAFDATMPHRVAAEIQGPALRAWVDGQAIGFDQGGKTVTAVRVPSLWDGPPKLGYNEGAAGISFWCEHHYDCVNGGQARNVVIRSAATPAGRP